MALSELKHYGVTGMHWGVRRYQNEDGTLTSAGKRRYGSKNKDKIVKRLAKDLNKLDDYRATTSEYKKRFEYFDQNDFNTPTKRKLSMGLYRINLRNIDNSSKEIESAKTRINALLHNPIFKEYSINSQEIQRYVTNGNYSYSGLYKMVYAPGKQYTVERK